MRGKRQNVKQRAEKKKRNEQEIISAALELFTTKGLRSTTIGDIVDHTTLARGTFYNYFKSKEEIWYRIIEQLFNEIQKEAKEGRKNARNLYEYIYYGIYAGIKMCNTPPYPALIAQNQVDFRELVYSNAVVSGVLIDYEREMRERGFLEDLPESFIRMTMYAMSGSALEIIIQSYKNNDQLSSEEITNFVTSIFEKNINNMKKKNPGRD